MPRKINQPKRLVIYSPKKNRKISRQIARGLDKITEAMMKCVDDDYAKSQIFKAIGELGDYLLDTDIRFFEDLSAY